jgi:LytR cell envelope-related transcriptional attenuator
MTLRTGAMLGLLIVVLGVGSGLANKRVRGAVFSGFSPGNAPKGVRVRVQVLNATSTRGLARRATELLRDRGFDVVEVGTAGPSERSDSTIVMDRSGHPDWAARVAKAMGGVSVLPRPDSSRYLDVTVLVGAKWRPPARPFNP